LILGAVLLWRVLLLVFTAQPVPANDAYFFDGAAVNSVQHGGFANPSLIRFTPFSATNVFCAYPPVYPLAMCGWMHAAGSGVLSSMWFHLVIFAGYLAVLAQLFHRWQLPGARANWAALFLLALTFDDRPDTLAHWFGLLALWGWLSIDRARWTGWFPALGVTLAFWTNPEVGLIYGGVLGLLALVKVFHRQWKFPVFPLAALILLPPLSVMLFKVWQPELWAGFLEHAKQTPSLTPLRVFVLNDWLKVLRAIPGTLCVAVVLPAHLRRENWSHPLFQAVGVMTLASLGIAAGAVTVFTADWVSLAKYMQPLVVGAFLTWRFPAGTVLPRRWVATLAALVLLAAVRAIGMSTWGAACAADMDRAQALQAMRTHVEHYSPGATVVFSSAYLYEASAMNGITALHEDWLHPIRAEKTELQADLDALTELKPAGMVLVQYDYYRRFQPVLRELLAHPEVVTITLTNCAHVPPPDAYHAMQRVLQHVAWAPVIVDFKWQEPSGRVGSGRSPVPQN